MIDERARAFIQSRANLISDAGEMFTQGIKKSQMEYSAATAISRYVAQMAWLADELRNMADPKWEPKDEA